MKKILFALFLLFNLPDCLYPAEYYISNKGNDNNDGLSPSAAWQSISKLNKMSHILRSGDNVLFERGGYFPGQIMAVKNGIRFSAYGIGSSPVISGAIPVKQWRSYNDKLLQADSDTTVKSLFVNGTRMTPARYPNTGFLTVTGSLKDSRAGFISSELVQKNGYWNNAIVRLRTNNWAFEYSPVKSYDNNTITFTENTKYPVLPGWGFYFDNVFSELDNPTEWYFDNATKNVYLYPPSGFNPDEQVIEASVYNFGIVCYENAGGIIIDGLCFKYQNSCGIFFQRKVNDLKIINCIFSDQTECGIEIRTGAGNIQISNNLFNSVCGKAVSMIGSDGGEISGNVITNTGMIPGFGTNHDTFGNSAIIILQSDSNRIHNNFIGRTGHDGITFTGIANRIYQNYILECLLTLNDGGAIKSYGKESYDNTWNNNFIFNVRGSLEGADKEYNYPVAAGAYLDRYCSRFFIRSNTIVDCGMSGVFLFDNCMNNVIDGNICYLNREGIFFYKEADPMSGNEIMNNIFYGDNKNSHSVRLKAPENGFIPGMFDHNYYCNPFSDNLFTYENSRARADYTFTEWKKFLSKDNEQNSKAVSGKSALYPVLLTNANATVKEFSLAGGVNYFLPGSTEKVDQLLIEPFTSRLVIAGKETPERTGISTFNAPLNFIRSNPSEDVSWFMVRSENPSEEFTITSPTGYQISTQPDTGFTNEIFVSKGIQFRVIYVKNVSGNDDKILIASPLTQEEVSLFVR